MRKANNERGANPSLQSIPTQNKLTPWAYYVEELRADAAGITAADDGVEAA
jgi:hypothetical protein